MQSTQLLHSNLLLLLLTVYTIWNLAIRAEADTQSGAVVPSDSDATANISTVNIPQFPATLNASLMDPSSLAVPPYPYHIPDCPISLLVYTDLINYRAIPPTNATLAIMMLLNKIFHVPFLEPLHNNLSATWDDIMTVIEPATGPQTTYKLDHRTAFLAHKGLVDWMAGENMWRTSATVIYWDDTVVGGMVLSLLS
ncbi:MAG: hypothetical protein Q9163_001311 [Psora crenata]